YRLWLCGLALLASGCQALVTRPEPRLVGPQVPPPIGELVPTEKDRSTLPPYTIEPPDILFIEAIRLVPRPPYRIQATDVLSVEIEGTFPTQAERGTSYLVDPAGRIDLGPQYAPHNKVH